MSDSKRTSRRNFLKGTTAAAAGLTLSSLARTAHAAGSDRIRVALIGCGGRGKGALEDCLTADPTLRVMAVADAFEGPAQFAAKHVTKNFSANAEISSDRIFVGLDAYQKAIDCGVDMIITATPPGFRPLIYNAAIAAGKHVFMEKPCCVDSPGFNLLMQTNALADQKGLKVGVGLQRRHAPAYLETVARIKDGALGKIMFLQAFWNGDTVWNRRRLPNMSEMQYQVNNWYHFCWLSGDHICEQHVHNLDVCNWVMGDHPFEANGMGGCTERYLGDNKGTGQIFDHHFVEFTYKDAKGEETKLYSQCRQISNTWSCIAEHAYGTLGHSDASGGLPNAGNARAKRKSRKTFPSDYIQEHHDLLTAIKNDEKYNEGWYGATSSMTAVLGRMATYSGKVIRWDDAVKLGKSEFPKQLAWDVPAPVQKDADGNYPIPVPGVYQAFQTVSHTNPLWSMPCVF